MAKPDYETLLGQIAAETDPTQSVLEAQCFVFLEPLTEERKNSLHIWTMIIYYSTQAQRTTVLRVMWELTLVTQGKQHDIN